MTRFTTDQTTSAGFTLIEVLFVVAIVGLLAGLAMPGLRRAQMAGNESSAIGSLRTIATGQQSFSSSCGFGLYAPSLVALAKPVGSSAGFLSPDLTGAATIVKSGYEIQVGSDHVAAGTSCSGTPLSNGYHATADPGVGKGRRYFAVNTNGAIYQSLKTMYGVIEDIGVPPSPATPLAEY
jgi:prepilin-type N-terminal cleavage/methylation domain-containing protein